MTPLLTLEEDPILFYSQLDFSLFKLLQRPFPLARRESGGELGCLDSSKELHEEEKSEQGDKKNPREFDRARHN